MMRALRDGVAAAASALYALSAGLERAGDLLGGLVDGWDEASEPSGVEAVAVCPLCEEPVVGAEVHEHGDVVSLRLPDGRVLVGNPAQIAQALP